MSILTKIYTFVTGNVIQASEHNTNFDTLFNGINGDLDNTNLKANAGIVDSKLAQITTAGKVSGAAITNLANIPPGAGVIPAANVNSVANDGTVNPTNLLSNGDFESWSAGTSVAPDGWTAGALYTTVAREATTSLIKLGTYSVKVTSNGTQGAFLYQSIHTTKGIAYWKGRTITLGAWVYCATATKARIMVYDGITETYSSYHTGNSTFQWLTITKTLSGSATEITINLDILSGAPAVSAYFDGAMCVEGESAFAFSPAPVNPIANSTTLSVFTAASGPVGAQTAIQGWIAINVAGTQRFIPYW
jgi:hypothetical protein